MTPPPDTPPSSPSSTLEVLPPDYSRFLPEHTRLETYTTWPHERPCAALLSSAGFFHLGTPHADTVRCPECLETISNFQPNRTVWDVLQHRRDCIFRPKIGETKNRSCTECLEIFATIGSKLNHCKRAHPLPEGERLRKRAARLERTRRNMAREGRGVYKSRYEEEGMGLGGRTRLPMGREVSLWGEAKRRAAEEEASRAEMIMGRGEVEVVDCEMEEEDRGPGTGKRGYVGWGMRGVKQLTQAEPDRNGLSYSGVVTAVDAEPSAWTGEIVMSRAEYREFRQHFRAMTHIFRDVDPKKRDA